MMNGAFIASYFETRKPKFHFLMINNQRDVYEKRPTEFRFLDVHSLRGFIA